MRIHIQTQQPPPRYLQPKDAAARWGCSVSLIYRLLGDKLLKAKKFSSKLTLIDVAVGDAYFDSLPDAEIKPDRHRSKLPASEGA